MSQLTSPERPLAGRQLTAARRSSKKTSPKALAERREAHRMAVLAARSTRALAQPV
jgi:hypothetical protein